MSSKQDNDGEARGASAGAARALRADAWGWFVSDEEYTRVYGLSVLATAITHAAHAWAIENAPLLQRALQVITQAYEPHTEKQMLASGLALSALWLAGEPALAQRDDRMRMLNDRLALLARIVTLIEGGRS